MWANRWANVTSGKWPKCRKLSKPSVLTNVVIVSLNKGHHKSQWSDILI